jgi:shikimate dehydrogenase
MTDARTQLVGLLGWPVEHSLSPTMHNAAFAALGLNWQYVPLPVAPGQVAPAVNGLSALGFRGANVTVPHKQAVMPAIDSTAPDAAALGAVNTLVIKRCDDDGPQIHGHNTDADGFVEAVREGGADVGPGTNTVVVGAGGAARAVVYGLLRARVSDIVVLNRTYDRAQALTGDLHPAGTKLALRALPLKRETLIESARRADLLVNATAVGMWPHVAESIWPESIPVPTHLTVFDLVYNPLETRLLRQAKQSGANPIDGLGMLVLQGALAFTMWTGVGPAREVSALMRAACERTLRQ